MEDAADADYPTHVSSCDKRTSYVPCLQLLLTVWAGRVTINILPDDVLLLIFHFDRVIYLDGLMKWSIDCGIRPGGGIG
jgi:hypothetical protein